MKYLVVCLMFWPVVITFYSKFGLLPAIITTCVIVCYMAAWIALVEPD